EGADARTLAEQTLAAVYAADAAHRVAVGSFSDTILWEVHNRDPSIPLIAIVEDLNRLPNMLTLPIYVVAVRMDMIEEALEAAPPGVAVWSWTAYNIAMAQSMVERGVHGIITDVPNAVVK